MFITTAEFLPQHRAHRQQVLQIISAAQASGQTRLTEMNQPLLGSSFARCGTRPSSRSAYRRARPPDPNGVVVLHMSKTRPGRAPP